MLIHVEGIAAATAAAGAALGTAAVNQDSGETMLNLCRICSVHSACYPAPRGVFCFEKAGGGSVTWGQVQ